MKQCLHSLDLVLGLRLLQGDDTLQHLSDDLGVSISQVHASVARLRTAQLLRADSRTVNRLSFEEFLLHGARYVFAPEIGPEARGIPTAHAGPAFADHVVPTDPMVWPSPDGTMLGHALTPLYPAATRLPQTSPETYRLLTLFDALRAGRAREKNLAREQLRSAIRAEHAVA